jgi:hypothetical protein
MRKRILSLVGLAGLAGLMAISTVPAAAVDGDVLVTVGSPAGQFSQNKQNEPAVAIDPAHPTVLVAGANDNIDMEACNAGTDNTCPFTDGVGVSGVYFSFDGGASWIQPTYSGLSARGCLGTPGDSDPACVPTSGSIGTLPWYYEGGLVSDGDPAVAFGPVPGPDGTFSWSNGSRLYYANLTSNLPGIQAFKGFEAIAVSRIDGPAGTGLTSAIVANQANWEAPVVASKQNSALFSDKEQIWADNAASSPYFGNAYVCFAGFKGAFGGGFTPQPLYVLTSRDGGDTWAQKQVTSSTNNISSVNGFGRSGCTVRTDSNGVVYVFVYQFAFGTPGEGAIQLIKSFDGGATWSRPRNIQTAFDTCNFVEDSIGRCVMDGIGGARDDLSPAPSVDIANGAPTGSDATNRIVLTWVDGRDGNDHEHVFFTTSTDGGSTWTSPITLERTVGGVTDRGYYSAPAISPNGTDVWLVYNAFTTPFRNNTTDARSLVGVVLHADVTGAGIGPFSEVHRGAPGDPRGSAQNNLAAEFLGDYVYAAATRTFGTAVWNDVRYASECADINTYRQALHDEAVALGVRTADPEEPRGTEEFEREHGLLAQPTNPATAPSVQSVCPGNFGNSDIFGGSWPDPTP